MADSSTRRAALVPVEDFVSRVMSVAVLDAHGQPAPGFGPAMRRGAVAHALLLRSGVDPHTHRNTLTRYHRLYAAAGVRIHQGVMTCD